MAYKVIRYFKDLQDNDYLYQEGDIFPREGFKVTASRLKELSGSNNKQGCPLIKSDEAKDVTKKKANKKTEKTESKENTESTD